MQSMKQKFNPNTFNFTKMDEREIIFEMFDEESKEHSGKVNTWISV